MATPKTPGQTVENTDINPNLNNDAYTTNQRYAGLNAIWSNPNAGSTACSRQQAYSNAEKTPKFATAQNPFNAAGVPAPADGALVQASDTAAAANVINSMVASTNSLISTPAVPSQTPPGQAASAAVVQSGQVVSASDVNNLISTIDSIVNIYNAYNSWFDGGDLCAKSCQVACQTACQTSCQGCNTSQCHNQKCGVH